MYCASSSCGGFGWDVSPFMSMMQSQKDCIWRRIRGELAFYLTLEIVSNQLPHKRTKSLQSEIAKKLTHKEITTLKSFWCKVRIVENQTKRSKKKVIILGGKKPKIKRK